MADATRIEWADATFNPWWGCERVSPGCAHCYADGEARRRGHRIWGPEHGFRFLSDDNWAKPLRWARLARDGRLPSGEENRDGHRPRVFCASMADVFEERPELDEPRHRLFRLIEETPELDWLVLTKRPEFARDWLRARFWPFGGMPPLAHLPESHGCPKDAPAGVYPANLWMGVSIENARFTWRADVLREIPAAVRFISAEPLLGSLFDSAPAMLASHPERPHRDAGAGDAAGRGRKPLDLSGIEWVIVGGESGAKARPFHLEHAREIIQACDLCPRCGGGGPCPVCGEDGEDGQRPAVFVKQLGAKPRDHGETHLLRDRKGGDWDEWPADLRIREFPVGVGVPA